MREPVTLTWAGGRENAFLLRSGEMIALEKACDAGIGRIYMRLVSSLTGNLEWYVADVMETLRLGLIGGGMSRDEAAKTVSTVADWHGPMALAPIAAAVLSASLKPADDDEDDDDEAKKKAASTDELTRPPSTEAVL